MSSSDETTASTTRRVLSSSVDRVVGLDGCAGGWFAVRTVPDDTGAGAGGYTLESERYTDIAAVFDAHASADRLLVDMPIGLPVADSRACDREVRRRLGARGRSVFPTPCRAVVEYCGTAGDDADYERATEIQREHTGAGLSKQTWNITPKIAALDRLLRERSPSIAVYESHPEYCFARLNDGYPVAQPKSTPAGRAARFGVLASAFEADAPDWRACYREALDTHYRKHVARDDVVDALVLAAAGRRPLAAVPAAPPTDDRGLPMRIVGPAAGPSWHRFDRLADR